MSWLYSRALVEEFSAATCSDGAQSALSSGSLTPQAFLPSDRMTAFSRPSRFGMTFAPLTDTLGAELLTWCQAASRARTSALPAKEQALTEPDRECGGTWRGSLARFDPDTFSWRTAQPSLLEDLGESSVTWPRSGMTAAGQCWELPMLGRRINATESGLWRTPQAQEGMRGVYKSKEAMDAHLNRGHQLNLSNQVVHRHLWPTPTAHNAKETNAPSEKLRNEPSLASRVGGQLNPTWVEWLMGWPLGWTDLKPLETDKCPSALPPLGDC
jgi:hypothetical protein